MQRIVIFGLVGILATAAGYFVYLQVTRPPHALEVDATRDTTDISGILYRIRVTNVGTEPLTGIVAELGANDIQQTAYLDPGQSYYFYPEPETKESTIRVTTKEGIQVLTNYRTPTKVIGLPGAGR
ncbi:MAG: hypothetical protein MN733_11185 [Nitrososphaera sp.]|nr:hypothetical protein [Nitrososphaera sp.]